MTKCFEEKVIGGEWQGAKKKVGALERIRTSDRLVRSQVLYPAELRARQGRE
jgi:hypothetical protein